MPFLYFAERTRHAADAHDERLDSVSFRPRPVWYHTVILTGGGVNGSDCEGASHCFCARIMSNNVSWQIRARFSAKPDK
jgi:hypothetical protein